MKASIFNEANTEEEVFFKLEKEGAQLVLLAVDRTGQRLICPYVVTIDGRDKTIEVHGDSTLHDKGWRNE